MKNEKIKVMKNKKQIFAVVASVIITVFSVVLIASAVTTVGNNVSVGGDFAVSGNATTTGNQVISGNLSVHGAFSPDSFTFNPGSIFTVNGTSTFSTTSFLGDVNFNLKQIKNVVLEKLSNFPSSPMEGQMFWSTATSTPYWYDAANTRWRTQGSEATIVVAASDSRNKEKADYVCDGTDDQVEIKAAIDALPDTGGRVVLLEGTFYINSEILISDLVNNNNVVLEGQGMGTILTFPTGNASTMNIIDVYGSSVAVTGVTIKNLRIDGNKTNVTGGYYNGIKFNNVATSTIDNVYLSNGKGNGAGDGYGYWIINSTNITIRNCTGKTWDFEPMEIRGSSKILVTECWLEFRCELYDTNDNIKFSNNYFYNFTLYVGTDTSSSNFADYIDISNNYFYINNLAYPVVQLVRSRYSSVVANHFYSTQGYSVILSSVGGSHLVANNFITITAADSSGIYGVFSTSSIIGNYIYQAAANYGIVLTSGVQNTEVKNNTIINTATSGWRIGIQLDAASTANNEIDGNTISGEHKGINNAGNTNIFTRNRIVASSNVAISNTGTGNIIKQNIGYTTENSGSATITSGNTSTTVSHSLSAQPATSTIAVVPTNNLGSATKFWVSNVATTTFQINTDIDPGVTTATFNWQIGSY